MWVGHVWCKQGVIVKQVIELNPMGKRSSSRSRLRWESCEKKYVKKIEPEISRRNAAEDGDG